MHCFDKYICLLLYFFDNNSLEVEWREREDLKAADDRAAVGGKLFVPRTFMGNFLTPSDCLQEEMAEENEALDFA